MKPLLDITVSLLALLLIFPIFIIICFAIKLDSNGPILFKQKRTGQNDNYFMIYKFRTMQIDTPNLSTDKLTNPEQYVTKVGRFLRKTSFDEIPQLLNIVKGEMSLVGPRPALYNQYELINKRKTNGINSLKPGLTGYAQIMGRDFISDEKKVEYDKYYLKNVTIVSDVKIILSTFTNVVKAENVKM
ncbi:sugar transferase [Alkalihalobacillus sp. AL-G]|uniref:sugar transferase n=1 Tax=Alkalihalobacillus sp. AL-G TaxID=2926399 RepID=UPI00351AFFE8|nr:sugar transferase [Alkalihalobacillus sp. AL-G]